LKLKTYINNKLNELLEKHRIVVWYDSSGDFSQHYNEFSFSNTAVLSKEKSTLQTRREADEIYCNLMESGDPNEANKKILIYNPVRRGSGDEARRSDPFEVYALIGTAFGDTEDQTLISLARQAMPEMAAEINRLFEESEPDLDLLDGLEEGHSYPLLKELLGTETPAEIIALAVCDDEKAVLIDEEHGCATELLRLLNHSVGFKPVDNKHSWKDNRKQAVLFLLFGEFALSNETDLPEELAGLSLPGLEAADIVKSACRRMRSDINMESRYINLANKIEGELHLADLACDNFVPGGNCTFPFEERLLLKGVAKKILEGDYNRAIEEIDNRKNIIWRRDSAKEADWKVLERAGSLLKSIRMVESDLSNHSKLDDMVKAYTESWFELDRYQRLFEYAVTAIGQGKELKDIIDLCRNDYRDLAFQLQDKLLQAVDSEGWPPEKSLKQTRIFDDFIAPALGKREKTAYFLVDSLRYEMGQDLGEAMLDIGEVKVLHAAGVVPTVTDLGMAALLPNADGALRLVENNGKIVPTLGDKLVPDSSERMKMLQDQFGDRFFETTYDELSGSFGKNRAKLNSVDFLVIRTQDPDVIAENLGSWRARKYLSSIVGEICILIKALLEEGYTYIVVTSDHGHWFLPEVIAGEVVQEAPGNWVKKKRRCLLGKTLADATGTVIFKADHLGLSGDIDDICIPKGLKVFSHGSGYFHGGLSLQEALIPVVVMRSTASGGVMTGKPEIEIRYRDDCFTSRVIGLQIFLKSNLFKPSEEVLVEVYDGKGPKANLVGEAADCEARDDRTGLVKLQADQKNQVPVLIDPDFSGDKVEIRVTDPHTKAVWARKELINDMLD